MKRGHTMTMALHRDTHVRRVSVTRFPGGSFQRLSIVMFSFFLVWGCAESSSESESAALEAFSLDAGNGGNENESMESNDVSANTQEEDGSVGEGREGWSDVSSSDTEFTSSSDAGFEIDSEAESGDGDEPTPDAQSDAESGNPTEGDTATDFQDDTETEANDAGETESDTPEWVDPEVPEGPIPATEGTDTTPEEEDFDWTNVGTFMIGNSLPVQALNWEEYPLYGTATILDWSKSEKCVCFDVNCSTCSEDTCSAETCTYPLNDSHALTKYHVELRSNDYPGHALNFEVNVSAAPAIVYTDIAQVLQRLERIPVEYWYGLKIITEFGHGIQFLHGSYFGGGAAAYGSMNYIDTQTTDMEVLLHELGHTFEQYTRIGNPPTLEPQSNILNPIWRNAIRSDDNRTSWYGNSNEWEDMAEFSRIHAQCLVEGNLDVLEGLSPERFRIWELILLNGTTIKP